MRALLIGAVAAGLAGCGNPAAQAQAAQPMQVAESYWNMDWYRPGGDGDWNPTPKCSRQPLDVIGTAQRMAAENPGAVYTMSVMPLPNGEGTLILRKAQLGEGKVYVYGGATTEQTCLAEYRAFYRVANP